MRYGTILDEEVRQSVTREVRVLGPKTTLVFLINPAHASDAYVSIVAGLRDEGYSGVMVVANRPFRWWCKALDAHGVDREDLVFVDCVSKAIERVEERENVVYLGSLISLEKIHEAVSRALPRVRGEKTFVLLDSLLVLSLYSSLKDMKELLSCMRSCAEDLHLTGVALCAVTPVPELESHMKKVARIVDLR